MEYDVQRLKARRTVTCTHRFSEFRSRVRVLSIRCMRVCAGRLVFLCVVTHAANRELKTGLMLCQVIGRVGFDMTNVDILCALLVSNAFHLLIPSHDSSERTGMEYLPWRISACLKPQVASLSRKWRRDHNKRKPAATAV